MKIIVGLGNPGAQYEATRHNIGAKAVAHLMAEYAFPKAQAKNLFLATSGKLDSEDALLVIPLTFMNASGKAIKAALRTFPLPNLSDLWVVHDELDLPLGTIRISVGASAAGHNGVQSIIDELGSKDFVRFRLGIASDRYQEIKKHNPSYAEDYVLEKFGVDEESTVAEMVQKASRAMQKALENGIEQASKTQRERP